MKSFKVVSKDNVDIEKKPRVYFTCHPEDFEIYFKKLCDDIFKTHDCAIYYTEDMINSIGEVEKETDLGRSNLFVVPITFKLLTTPNRAMDEDIPYAIKEHIPILPVMMEPGIDEFYSQPNKFGELQYLNPYSTDLTEISYEEKLRKYLESVLISDELAKRVRAAFDAYIFLSYRKTDRKYANELMRLIHSNPECRDIAIWFDEFLTPGESFKENIEKILDDCKLFTLLITPQLLKKVIDENGDERDNYVISTELPLAMKNKAEKGIDIFAVEMENTDRESLLKLNINDYVNPEDQAFHERLVDAISRMAITTNNTPEHNFLIGLAYLDGIDVEVDRNRAVELITASSDAGLIEATKKLRDMYHDGIAVERNYNTALSLGKKTIELCDKNPDIDTLETAIVYEDLAYLYYEIDEYQQAVPLFEKAYNIKANLLGEKHDDVLATMKNYAIICYLAGKNYFSHEKKGDKFIYTFSKVEQIEKSIELFEKMYSIQLEVNGESVESLLTLCYLALTCSFCKEKDLLAENYRKKAYQKIKNISVLQYDYIDCLSVLASSYRCVDLEKTLQLNRMAYALSNSILGLQNLKTVETLLNLANVYFDIGNDKHTENESDDSIGIDEYNEAVKLYNEAYLYECELLGENHVSTIDTLSRLSTAYWYLDEDELQFETLQKIYECQSVVFGEEDSRTLQTLEKMADTWFVIGGEYKETIKLVEKIYKLQCVINGEKHPDSILALKRVAKSYEEQDDFDIAISLYDKVFALSCEVFGVDSREAIFALEDVAKCHYQFGKYDTALSVCEEVIDIENKSDTCSKEHKTVTMGFMAKICYALNRRKDTFSICDQLQLDGILPGLTVDEIANVQDLELDNFIEKIELCEKNVEFVDACNYYKRFLKTLALVEGSNKTITDLKDFNLIKAIVYHRIAYCYRNLNNYSLAKMFYSLAVMNVIVEARNSLDIDLYDISINCLERVVNLCQAQADDNIEMYYAVQTFIKAERKKIQDSYVDCHNESETTNDDVLSSETQAELEMLFDELFTSLSFNKNETNDFEQLFNEAYEESLIKNALKEIFKLSLASCLEINFKNDEKEIVLLGKNEHKKIYTTLDTLNLNGQEISILADTGKEDDLVLVLNETHDEESNKVYSQINIDDFFKVFFEKLK